MTQEENKKLVHADPLQLRQTHSSLFLESVTEHMFLPTATTKESRVCQKSTTTGAKQEETLPLVVLRKTEEERSMPSSSMATIECDGYSCRRNLVATMEGKAVVAFAMPRGRIECRRELGFPWEVIRYHEGRRVAWLSFAPSNSQITRGHDDVVLISISLDNHKNDVIHLAFHRIDENSVKEINSRTLGGGHGYFKKVIWIPWKISDDASDLFLVIYSEDTRLLRLKIGDKLASSLEICQETNGDVVVDILFKACEEIHRSFQKSPIFRGQIDDVVLLTRRKDLFVVSYVVSPVVEGRHVSSLFGELSFSLVISYIGALNFSPMKRRSFTYVKAFTELDIGVRDAFILEHNDERALLQASSSSGPVLLDIPVPSKRDGKKQKVKETAIARRGAAKLSNQLERVFPIIGRKYKAVLVAMVDTPVTTISLLIKSSGFKMGKKLFYEFDFHRKDTGGDAEAGGKPTAEYVVEENIIGFGECPAGNQGRSPDFWILLTEKKTGAVRLEIIEAPSKLRALLHPKKMTKHDDNNNHKQQSQNVAATTTLACPSASAYKELCESMTHHTKRLLKIVKDGEGQTIRSTHTTLNRTFKDLSERLNQQEHSLNTKRVQFGRELLALLNSNKNKKGANNKQNTVDEMQYEEELLQQVVEEILCHVYKKLDAGREELQPQHGVFGRRQQSISKNGATRFVGDDALMDDMLTKFVSESIKPAIKKYVCYAFPVVEQRCMQIVQASLDAQCKKLKQQLADLAVNCPATSDIEKSHLMKEQARHRHDKKALRKNTLQVLTERRDNAVAKSVFMIEQLREDWKRRLLCWDKQEKEELEGQEEEYFGGQEEEYFGGQEGGYPSDNNEGIYFQYHGHHHEEEEDEEEEVEEVEVEEEEEDEDDKKILEIFPPSNQLPLISSSAIGGGEEEASDYDQVQNSFMSDSLRKLCQKGDHLAAFSMVLHHTVQPGQDEAVQQLCRHYHPNLKNCLALLREQATSMNPPSSSTIWKVALMPVVIARLLSRSIQPLSLSLAREKGEASSLQKQLFQIQGWIEDCLVSINWHDVRGSLKPDDLEDMYSAVKVNLRDIEVLLRQGIDNLSVVKTRNNGNRRVLELLECVLNRCERCSQSITLKKK